MFIFEKLEVRINQYLFRLNIIFYNYMGDRMRIEIECEELFIFVNSVVNDIQVNFGIIEMDYV